MPNFLKLTDLARLPIVPVVGSGRYTPVGIGNSPPAMNVADSPEIAVRFGSASVRTTPALSIARIVAVTDGRPALFRAAPQAVARDQRAAVGGERVGVVEIHDRGAVVHAGGEIDAHLLDDVAPHFGDLTFNITWSRPRTTMELTTLSAPPTSRAAMSPACCASTGARTEPVRITPSPTPSI